MYRYIPALSRRARSQLPASVVEPGGTAMEWTSASFRACALAVLVAPTPAMAERLQEALADVYAGNPRLLAARAQLRAVDEEVARALSGWRPTVTITGSAGLADEREFTGVTVGGSTVRVRESLARQTSSVAATVTQPIYRGGRTIAETRRAEANVLAQRARLISTEQSVLRDAVSAYTGLFRAEVELELRRDYARVLSRLRDASRQRQQVGEVTRTDVAQSEARLAAAIASREEAMGTLQSARATFRRVIGRAAGTLAPPQPLVALFGSPAEAGDRAARDNPDVVASFFAEVAAREDVGVQASQTRPQLSLEAAASRDDNDDARDERENGLRIGLRFSVPLVQSGLEMSQVRAARQQAQAARMTLEADRRTARRAGVEAQSQRETAAARLRSADAQVAAAEVALRGVQAEFLSGSRSQVDLLNAQQELLDAQLSAVSARVDLIEASYAVAAAVGRLTAADLDLPVRRYDPTEHHRQARRLLFGTAGRAGEP